MATTEPVIESRVDFKYNTELVNQYGTYENYLAAQQKALKTTSAWTYGKNAYMDMRNKKLAKHNAESEVLIERYQNLEKVYKAMKKQQTLIENKLCSKYDVGSSKDLSLALKEENSLTDQSKFNVAAKNADEARINYETALSTALYQTHQIV